jgi:hypothetical protein
VYKVFEKPFIRHVYNISYIQCKEISTAPGRGHIRNIGRPELFLHIVRDSQTSLQRSPACFSLLVTMTTNKQSVAGSRHHCFVCVYDTDCNTRK